MAKVKILKKLPKSKQKFKKNNTVRNSTKPVANTYSDSYLKFYDDIKIPTKRGNDW